MDSKISSAIFLNNQPIAIFKSDTAPMDAMQFKPGVWGCVVAMLAAASKGKTAAFQDETTTCVGGKAGLGLKPFELGVIEHFLSTGEVGPKAGEFYKKTPDLARSYIHSMPAVSSKPYVILKPLSALENGETPEAVIFLVNADQLSALVTLASYDQEGTDSVQIRFGAGCAQAILFPMADQENGIPRCTIGLTDPSARKCIDKDLLSFSIPYDRFLIMESQVEESFLTKETWTKLRERI